MFAGQAIAAAFVVGDELGADADDRHRDGGHAPGVAERLFGGLHDGAAEACTLLAGTHGEEAEIADAAFVADEGAGEEFAAVEGH